MSEDLDQQADGASSEDENEEQLNSDEDLLILYGGLVRAGKMSFDVTLWVKGLVLRGTFVGPQVYFETLSAHLRRHGQGEATISLASELEEDAKIYSELEPVMGDFVYLINASMLTTSGWLPINGPWRGRVSSVDGYTWGTFSLG